MRQPLNIVSMCVLAAALVIPAALRAGDSASAEDARQKAVTADAPALAAKNWEKGEKYRARAIDLADRKANEDKIAATYDRAIEAYDEAELEALTISLLDPARRALRAAEDDRAKKFAPETYTRAVTELQAAEATLQADRYAVDEINELVGQAVSTANLAARVARIAGGKPDTETLILARNADLDRIAAAAGYELPDDATTAARATELEQEVDRLYKSEQQLRNDLIDSREFVAALEEEIRELDQQLGGASKERRQLVLQLESQARTEEKFRQTEAMFDESEADVFRQSDAIVIRLFGLEFESGSSELGPDNQPLLDKLGRAVELYPGAVIVVEGHTDSQGSSRLNQRLSQNRADAVADYMVRNMRVPANLLEAIGYGASRPIANNETEEGRARNRRIDLIIRPAE